MALRGKSAGALRFPLPDKDDFDSSPCLNNQRLASYEWGSGELLFSPPAALKDGFVVKSFIELLQGKTSLEDSDDLICLIALVHEYRHFQQDFLTGVGNWDYVARIDKVISTLSLAKQLSADGFITVPMDPEMVPFSDGEITSILHGNPATEIGPIKSVLVDEFKAPVELAGLFTTRRLLEMDAVLYTYELITSTKLSLKGRDNLKKLKEFFSYTQMPSIYAETTQFCLLEFLRGIKEDLALADRIDNIIRWLRLLLTLALAHPDPVSVHANNLQREDYIPGVRFLRLMRALGKRLQDPEGNYSSMREFESKLINATGLQYQSYLDFGEGWSRYLGSMQRDPFASVTTTRKSTLDIKFENHVGSDEKVAGIYSAAIVGESLMSFSHYDLPLFMRRTDGESHPLILTGRVFHDPHYNVDRLRSVLAWRLAEFISRRRGAVLCPLTEAYCNVRTDRCKEPFATLSDLPLNPGCLFRQTCFDSDPQHIRL